MANSRRERNQMTTNDNNGSAFGSNMRYFSFDFESQVTGLVNQERARAGLPSLTLSEDISYMARLKSQDMRDMNYFSHQSLTFGSPFDMLSQFDINYRFAGENIARGQRTPQAVMNAWMNSEGHRRNILDQNFTEFGVGFVKDARGNTYWTQLFVTR